MTVQPNDSDKQHESPSIHQSSPSKPTSETTEENQFDIGVFLNDYPADTPEWLSVPLSPVVHPPSSPYSNMDHFFGLVCTDETMDLQDEISDDDGSTDPYEDEEVDIFDDLELWFYFSFFFFLFLEKK